MNRLKKILLVVMGLWLSIGIYSSLSDNGDRIGLFNNGEPYRMAEGTPYVPGRLIVKIAPLGRPAGTVPPGKTVQSTLWVRYRHRIEDIRLHLPTGYLVVTAGAGSDIEGLRQALLQDPLVKDVSFDYIASIASVVPNDPHFDRQHYLFNFGQTYDPTHGSSGTAGSDINAVDGWDWTTGDAGVVIAVLDTGAAAGHEDLGNKLVPGYNFFDQNPDSEDDHGHGTLVASIAAAETDNGMGIAGVSWNSRIMPVKVVNSSGRGPYSVIADGIRYAADNGARVINLSLGGRAESFILEDACRYAFEAGCVIVAAAGNYGNAVIYPAAYDDYCLAVGATDAHDNIAAWSNSGPEVDVAAPGVDILGALFFPFSPHRLDLYGFASGTSYATPQVAGAAALLVSYKPFLDNSLVMDLIKYTAADVNRSAHPGIDIYMGYGRLDLKTLLSPYILD